MPPKLTSKMASKKQTKTDEQRKNEKRESWGQIRGRVARGSEPGLGSMTACAGAGRSQVEGRGLPKRQVSQAKRARAGVREEVDHGGSRCRDSGFLLAEQARARLLRKMRTN